MMESDGKPSTCLSGQACRHFLPRIPHLGDERQRLWTYSRLWPNIASDIYLDRIGFMRRPDGAGPHDETL
ncbi:hypothetical protein NUH86_19810 [Sphingobium sp. JS3065]|uniref:hypothetical protein n=1 Tax=Sphingobium sp. JS3065 TaxID=2970925 RepID=UPI002264990E|nr:hypothetical protein [Sphingobium sp. JS3065]UZW57002.1 hypothetical protein NUH86_19810 [Sphingobium sp. JS3065]